MSLMVVQLLQCQAVEAYKNAVEIGCQIFKEKADVAVGMIDHVRAGLLDPTQDTSPYSSCIHHYLFLTHSDC